MAKIARFFRTTTASRPHPTEVECGWQIVSGPDGDMLQLSTFGSDSRASDKKVSQTFQLDRDAAAELVSIVGQAFPGLGEHGPADTSAKSERPVSASAAKRTN
jgi:5-methylcytosine-specific restriction protein B